MALQQLSNLASSAANTINQLSTVAKGVLCIPSLISGISGSLTGLAGGIAAGVASAAAAAIQTAVNLTTNIVSIQVARITGAVNTLIDTVTSAIATIGAAIAVVRGAIEDIRQRAQDIRDFVSNKENCNFAAASLASCMISQALGSFTPRLGVSISKGLVKIDEVGDSIASRIASPTGAVGRYMDKAGSTFNRASSVISTTRLF